MSIILSKSQTPLPFLSTEQYQLSINFWPVFSKIKEISVDEYYFLEILDPPPFLSTEYLDKTLFCYFFFGIIGSKTKNCIDEGK